MGAVLLPALTVSVEAIPMRTDSSSPRSLRASERTTKSTSNTTTTPSVTIPAVASPAAVGPNNGSQVSASALKSASTKPKNSNSRRKSSAGANSLNPSSWVLSGFGAAPVSLPNTPSNLGGLAGIDRDESGLPVAPPLITPVGGGNGAGNGVGTVPGSAVPQTVPDGGATAVLLGLGVCGFGWLRRRFGGR